MQLKSVADLLLGIPLLSAFDQAQHPEERLSYQEWIHFARNVELVEVGAEWRVQEQGVPADRVCIVASGECGVYRQNSINNKIPTEQSVVPTFKPKRTALLKRLTV